MAGYVKMWTAIRSDRGFLALSCNARGAYMQLIVAAKEQRDDGTVCYRNVAAMGADWGCDRATSAKILRKIADNSLCTYTTNKQGVVTIKVANYKKWQELTVRELVEKSAKSPRKIPPLRPDQTRPDYTILCDGLSPVELSNLFNELCPTLPKVRVMRPQDKRWKITKSRLIEHPDHKFWESLFKNVHKSDFLSARNGKWTACNYDWIMNPTNLIKIYEGNYENQRGMTAEQEQAHFRQKEMERSSRGTSESTSISKIIKKIELDKDKTKQ